MERGKHGHFFNDTEPLVTVVIPTCNRLELLPKALQSIALQTYDRFECLVINDHLTTKAKVESAVNELGDKRFRILHNANSLGVAATRNNGIRQAGGVIVAFLDDDDIWMPEYLEEHVQMHKTNEQAGLVYSGVILRWSRQVLPEKKIKAKPPPRQEEAASHMLQGKFNVFTTSALSIKKECLNQVGHFDENLPSFEDWDLCYRICQDFPLDFIEKPLTVYSQHLEYRITSDLSQRIKGLNAISQKYSGDEGFSDFYQKYYSQIHFVDIKNNVLTGKNEWNTRLLLLHLGKGARLLGSRYSIKVTLKMIILVLLGKPGFKIINLF